MEAIEVTPEVITISSKPTLTGRTEFLIHWSCSCCGYQYTESWQGFDIDWAKPHVCPSCRGNSR